MDSESEGESLMSSTLTSASTTSLNQSETANSKNKVKAKIPAKSKQVPREHETKVESNSVMQNKVAKEKPRLKFINQDKTEMASEQASLMLPEKSQMSLHDHDKHKSKFKNKLDLNHKMAAFADEEIKKLMPKKGDHKKEVGKFLKHGTAVSAVQILLAESAHEPQSQPPIDKTTKESDALGREHEHLQKNSNANHPPEIDRQLGGEHNIKMKPPPEMKKELGGEHKIEKTLKTMHPPEKDIKTPETHRKPEIHRKAPEIHTKPEVDRKTPEIKGELPEIHVSESNTVTDSTVTTTSSHVTESEIDLNSIAVESEVYEKSTLESNDEFHLPLPVLKNMQKDGKSHRYRNYKHFTDISNLFIEGFGSSVSSDSFFPEDVSGEEKHDNSWILDDSESESTTASNKSIVLEEKTQTLNFYKSMKVLLMTLKYLGRIPFKVYVEDVSGDLQCELLHLKHKLTFLVSTLILVIAFFVGSLSAGAIASDTRDAPYINFEKLLLQKHWLHMTHFLCTLLMSIFGSLSLIFNGTKIVEYVNGWGQTLKSLRYDASNGVRKICYANLILTAVDVVIWLPLFYANIFGLKESNRFITILLFRWVIPGERPYFTIAVSVLQHFVILFQLYILCVNRSLIAMILVFCRGIVNVAHHWNLRISLILGKVFPDTLELKDLKARLTYNKTLEDHFSITKLVRRTSKCFGGIFITFFCVQGVLILCELFKVATVVLFDLKREHEDDEKVKNTEVYYNRSLTEDSFEIAYFLFSTILLFTVFSLSTSAVGETVMNGFDPIRRHGLLLARSVKERKFVMSLTMSFGAKDPYVLNPKSWFKIDRSVIMGVLTGVLLILSMLVQLNVVNLVQVAIIIPCSSVSDGGGEEALCVINQNVNDKDANPIDTNIPPHPYNVYIPPTVKTTTPTTSTVKTTTPTTSTVKTTTPTTSTVKTTTPTTSTVKTTTPTTSTVKTTTPTTSTVKTTTPTTSTVKTTTPTTSTVKTTTPTTSTVKTTTPATTTSKTTTTTENPYEPFECDPAPQKPGQKWVARDHPRKISLCGKYCDFEHARVYRMIPRYENSEEYKGLRDISKDQKQCIAQPYKNITDGTKVYDCFGNCYMWRDSCGHYAFSLFDTQQRLGLQTVNVQDFTVKCYNEAHAHNNKPEFQPLEICGLPYTMVKKVCGRPQDLTNLFDDSLVWNVDLNGITPLCKTFTPPKDPSQDTRLAEYKDFKITKIHRLKAFTYISKTKNPYGDIIPFYNSLGLNPHIYKSYVYINPRLLSSNNIWSYGFYDCFGKKLKEFDDCGGLPFSIVTDDKGTHEPPKRKIVHTNYKNQPRSFSCWESWLPNYSCGIPENQGPLTDQLINENCDQWKNRYGK